METINYITVQSPIEASFTLIKNPPKHKEISTKGIIVTSSNPYEVGATLQVSLKLVSMTGSIDFLGKVFQCEEVSPGVYELYIKFYNVPYEKEKEIEEFIQETTL